MALSLPILTFHDITNRPSVISIPSEVFRKGIDKLYQSGYRTLRLTDIADFIRSRVPFPDRFFVITFDDGYASVYNEAFPILNRYGMSATVFLTVGDEKTSRKGRDRLPSLGGRLMLSWEEIREMQRTGFEFGAHTLTHPDLTRLPPDKVESEICESKKIISDTLGIPVKSFSYPYGRYNDQIRDIVRRHFVCACSDKLGMISEKSDIYALERVEMYYFRSHTRFNIIGTSLFPWYMRAVGIPRRFRRYLRNEK